MRVIASRQGYLNAQAGLAARESVLGVEVHRVWTSRFGRVGLPGRAMDYLSFFVCAMWRLRQLARPGEVVVTMTDPPLLSVLTYWVLAGRQVLLVNWLQDLFPEVAQALNVRGMDGRFGRWLRRLRDRSLRGAAVNVAISERMAERVLAAGVAASRVRVIHNWADAEAIRPLAPEANQLRREWELEDVFVVGYSGNLGRAHTYATLLQAAQLLDEAGTGAAPGTGQRAGPAIPGDAAGPAAVAAGAPLRPVMFLFIGGGVQWRALRGEVERLGLRNVRFQPYQERAALHLSLGVADVHWVSHPPGLEGLVVPSKFYGVAAAGRPVLLVGQPDGEIARLLADYDCGRWVAEGDGAGFAAAVERLRDDALLRGRQGANARRLLAACRT